MRRTKPSSSETPTQRHKPLISSQKSAAPNTNPRLHHPQLRHPISATFHRNSLEIPTNLGILSYAQTWPTWKGRLTAAFRVPQRSVCLRLNSPISLQIRDAPPKSRKRRCTETVSEDPRFCPKILAARRLFVPGYRKRLILQPPAIDFRSSPKSGHFEAHAGLPLMTQSGHEARWPVPSGARKISDSHTIQLEGGTH